MKVIFTLIILLFTSLVLVGIIKHSKADFNSNLALDTLAKLPDAGAIYAFDKGNDKYYVVIPYDSLHNQVGVGPKIYDSRGQYITDCPVMPNRPELCSSFNLKYLPMLWGRE